MLTPRPTPQTSANGVNLLLFFAFALAALVLLTHTLVDVYRTRAAVADAVRPAVGGIEADTALLPALARTNQLTGRLATASQHVSGSLTDVAVTMRHIDPTIRRVRSNSLSIERSVSGIAGSSGTIERRLVALETDVSSISHRAGTTATAYAAASRAVAVLPGDIAGAAASLRKLGQLIPAIARQASSIRSTLATADGHLVNINDNWIVRLTNLLQLSNLLGGSG